MNSRNNGNLAFGQRIMTTIKMNARDAAEWKIKLIITHLYGIMELLSRGISVPDPGFLVHPSCPKIRGHRAMEIAMEKPLLVPVPGMHAADQQLHAPWFMYHGQWRMVQALDGEFTNLGS